MHRIRIRLRYIYIYVVYTIYIHDIEHRINKLNRMQFNDLKSLAIAIGPGAWTQKGTPIRLFSFVYKVIIDQKPNP